MLGRFHIKRKKLINYYYLIPLYILILSLITNFLFVKKSTNDNNSKKAVYAIGDSITFGQKDCGDKGCQFIPETYLYLYAKSKYPIGTKYYNLAYSGTTAGCSFDECPDSDNMDNTSLYKNSYIKTEVMLPNNQSSLEKATNLTYHPAAGKARALIGEFDNIKNADVIVAFGRNDVNTKTITLDQFESGLETIVDSLINHNNEITLLTIPPMTKVGWQLYVPKDKLRNEFKEKIKNLNYPQELDSYFSSAVWEIAYADNCYIVPIHEYLYFHPNSNYYSTDEIHPGDEGHRILTHLLMNKSQVYKNDLEAPTVLNSQYITIKTDKSGYGQIIYYKDGNFNFSEPIELIAGQDSIIPVKNFLSTLYTNIPIKIKYN